MEQVRINEDPRQMTEDERRRTIVAIRGILDDLNSTDQRRHAKWDVNSPKQLTPAKDRYNWTLAQFLKYSTPSRLVEAVDSLYLVCSRIPPGKRDPVPFLSLAVALYMRGERKTDEEALKYFRHGFGIMMPDHAGNKSSLWAHYRFSKLLRRMGKNEEAEREERWLRNWVLNNPYALPPNEMREAISEEGEKHNNVWDHDTLRIFWEITIESPSKPGSLFSDNVIFFG